jgi:microsomal dipeptidase-like Zn-dependent dipeptidase
MTGDHFYTISDTELVLALEKYNYRDDGPAGYAFGIHVLGTTPFFRLVNSNSGDHFYTISEAERDAASETYGYLDEGIACFVYSSQPDADAVPLYRLLNLTNGDHFYTTSQTERDTALSQLVPRSLDLLDTPPEDIPTDIATPPVMSSGRAPEKHVYHDESTACYVHSTQVPHTLPLRRLVQVNDVTPLPRRIKGFADVHNHQFANLGFGGKAFVGAAYGPIEQALPHCDYGPDNNLLSPDWVHGPGGVRDVLGAVRGITSGISGSSTGAVIGGVIGGLLGVGFGGVIGASAGAGLGSAIARTGHLVGGYPEFDGWPRWNNLTHQAVYQDWLFRALQGGLRLLVVFAVNNELVANVVEKELDRTSDDMEAVRLQIDAAKEMERVIDDQSGGPGQGWYRIVHSPQQARDVINAGKLAVVLGIEVDYPFGSKAGNPTTPETLMDSLNQYYDCGIRHIFPIHFDSNAFGGTAFQNALIGDQLLPRAYNIVTRPATDDGYAYRGGRANIEGLTEFGKYFIRAMMSKGMIIDIDHMSAAAASDALDIAESIIGGYPVISSHTGFIDISEGDKRHEGNMKAETAERIRQLGGMVACVLNQGRINEINTWHGAGQTVVEHTSGGTSETWAQAYLYAIEKMLGGPVGFGTDFNGMINPTGPRFGPEAAPGGTPPIPIGVGIAGPTNMVSYPFRAITTGVELDRSVVGNKIFNINEDGLAHIGMFPDFIADLQQIGLSNYDLAPLLNSVEGYIQLWEKAELYKPAAPSSVGAPTWAQRTGGFLHTSENVDVICYEVQAGAIGSDAVEFVLELPENLRARKELVLVADDGQWTIGVEENMKINQNGLYRYQLPNGQLLFRKHKGILDGMREVLDISQLNDLPLGARVIFKWLQDN